MISNNIENMSFRKDVFWSVVLTLFFAIQLNIDWRNSRLVWYGSIAVVVLTYLFVYSGRIRLRLTAYLTWLLSFMALGVISMTWSISALMVIEVMKILIVLFVVLFFIQLSLLNGYSVNNLLKCFFIATMIVSIYLLITIDISALGDAQLGAHIIEGWNGNGIGFMTAEGALIGIYLLGESKNKLGKLLLLAASVLLGALTMYTGSRTAFILLVLGFVLYFWFRHPTKMVRNIIIAVLVLYIAFYLMMNVESFYNVLGSRFEGLFALFSGEGEVDSSSDIRNEFIENGKEWFKSSPIIGYGFNNYKELNFIATGKHTYAHNNFIEIAVDLGIIGLVFYYSVYVYLGVRLLKMVKESHLAGCLLAALVASLISQYGTVSYYSFYYNFLLLICFYVVTAKKKEREDSSL